MKQTELRQCLEAGGSFTIRAAALPFSTLVALAEAAAKGGGSLTLTDTDRLYACEILTLCRTAPGKLSFPDVKLES